MVRESKKIREFLGMGRKDAERKQEVEETLREISRLQRFTPLLAHPRRRRMLLTEKSSDANTSMPTVVRFSRAANRYRGATFSGRRMRASRAIPFDRQRLPLL